MNKKNGQNVSNSVFVCSLVSINVFIRSSSLHTRIDHICILFCVFDAYSFCHYCLLYTDRTSSSHSECVFSFVFFLSSVLGVLPSLPRERIQSIGFSFGSCFALGSDRFVRFDSICMCAHAVLGALYVNLCVFVCVCLVVHRVRRD